MFRFLCRNIVSTWKYLLCLTLALLLIAWTDAVSYELMSQKDIERKLGPEGSDRYQIINIVMGVNYKSREDFLNHYFEDTDQAMGSFRVVSGNSAAVVLPGVILIPLLVGGAYGDHSLLLSCRTGKSRTRQMIVLHLWIYMVIIALMCMSVLIYILRLYIKCQQTLPTSCLVRLLLFRSIVSASWYSFPLCFSMFLQNAGYSTLLYVGYSMLCSNVMPFQQPWLKWMPSEYLTNPTIWGADAAAYLGVTANSRLALNLLIGCMLWILVSAGISVIGYQKVSLKK